MKLIKTMKLALRCYPSTWYGFHFILVT